jgi:hypothetical protein
MFGSFITGTPREANVGVRNASLRTVAPREGVYPEPVEGGALHPGIFEQHKGQ